MDAAQVNLNQHRKIREKPKQCLQLAVQVGQVSIILYSKVAILTKVVRFGASPNFYDTLWPGKRITVRWENPDRSSSWNPSGLMDIALYKGSDTGEVEKISDIARKYMKIRLLLETNVWCSVQQACPGNTEFVIPESILEGIDYFIDFRIRNAENALLKQFLNISQPVATPSNCPQGAPDAAFIRDQAALEASLRSKDDTIKIVGGALGGVALLLFLGILALFFLLRRRKPAHDPLPPDYKPRDDYYYPSPQASPPINTSFSTPATATPAQTPFSNNPTPQNPYPNPNIHSVGNAIPPLPNRPILTVELDNEQQSYELPDNTIKSPKMVYGSPPTRQPTVAERYGGRTQEAPLSPNSTSDESRYSRHTGISEPGELELVQRGIGTKKSLGPAVGFSIERCQGIQLTLVGTQTAVYTALDEVKLIAMMFHFMFWRALFLSVLFQVLHSHLHLRRPSIKIIIASCHYIICFTYRLLRRNFFVSIPNQLVFMFNLKILGEKSQKPNSERECEQLSKIAKMNLPKAGQIRNIYCLGSCRSLTTVLPFSS